MTKSLLINKDERTKILSTNVLSQDDNSNHSSTNSSSQNTSSRTLSQILQSSGGKNLKYLLFNLNIFIYI
jgi:hypothetical protein